MEDQKINFNVVYCSGEDPEYPANELNYHSKTTKGWQSPKFCEYPQELALQFECPSHISQIKVLSHQSKIAQRIELFMGDGTNYSTAVFRRLGYLSLDPNTRFKYKTRELKSVFINSSGSFLKIRVHQCYPNELNPSNQVGIVAIKLQGKFLDQPINISPPLRQIEQNLTNVNDKEISGLLSKLNECKRIAVENEDYAQAKSIKLLEDEFKSFGLQLAKLEQSKLLAVREEDYDKAAEIKMKINEIRDNISSKVSENSDLLPSSMDQIQVNSPKFPQQIPPTQYSPMNYKMMNDSPNYYEPPPEYNDSKYESERPESRAIHPMNPSNRDPNFPSEQPNPSNQNISADHPLYGVSDISDLPEPEYLPPALSSKHSDWIHAFGEYIVQCLFSKSWNLRCAALQKITISFTKYDIPPTNKFNMIVNIVKTLINDKMAQVYIAAINMLDFALSTSNTISDIDLMNAIDLILKDMIDKLGDNNARIRQSTKESLSKMADKIPPYYITNLLMKPSKNETNKSLVTRLEVLEIILRDRGLYPDYGFSLQSIMDMFKTMNCFNHPKEDVRTITKTIIKLLAEKDNDYLHYEKYFAGLRPVLVLEFQDIILSTVPNGGEQALFSQSRMARQINVSDGVQDPSSRPTTSHTKNMQPPASDDFQCNFCGLRDPQFSEELLDEHYLYDCPMLTECSFCQSIIELSVLTDHLLNECKVEPRSKQCPRCKEPIKYDFFEKHIKRNQCPVAKPVSSANRCPLCHKDIPPGVEGWRTHYLSPPGCPKNARTSKAN